MCFLYFAPIEDLWISQVPLGHLQLGNLVPLRSWYDHSGDISRLSGCPKWRSVERFIYLTLCQTPRVFLLVKFWIVPKVLIPKKTFTNSYSQETGWGGGRREVTVASWAVAQSYPCLVMGTAECKNPFPLYSPALASVLEGVRESWSPYLLSSFFSRTPNPEVDKWLMANEQDKVLFCALVAWRPAISPSGERKENDNWEVSSIRCVT